MEALQGTDSADWSDDELEVELRAAQVRAEQVKRLTDQAAARRRIAVTEADRRDWTTYRTAKAMRADTGTVRAILAAAHKPTQGAPE